MHWNLNVYGDVHVGFFSLNTESTEVKVRTPQKMLFAETFVKDETNMFPLLQGLNADSMYFIFLGLFMRSELFTS